MFCKPLLYATLQCFISWLTLLGLLQSISGLRLTDTFLNRTYEHDEIAQVFVYNQDSDATSSWHVWMGSHQQQRCLKSYRPTSCWCVSEWKREKSKQSHEDWSLAFQFLTGLLTKYQFLLPKFIQLWLRGTCCWQPPLGNGQMYHTPYQSVFPM